MRKLRDSSNQPNSFDSPESSAMLVVASDPNAVWVNYSRLP